MLQPHAKSSPDNSRSGSIMRCAVYTRVSTDDQARGEYNSLESQRDICEHAIAVHQHEGWTTTLYFDDPGYSGKNLERPGIRALIQEVQSGHIDVVVAYKIDRITRHLPDFYEFWRILNQHKVNFVSATQSFDTGTPMGMLMLNMLLSFGQFEREVTVERIQHKIAERAKKGKWFGGWAPIGYEYDTISKTLSLHPGEAPIVRRIFELSKQLGSPAKVAAELNAEGLRTTERVINSRRGNELVVGGKRFIPHKIKVIVTNPVYKGVIRHQGEDHPAEHPALVTAKLWQEANDALSGKARPQSQARLERNTHQSLLKGLIHCGVCGHKLTPKPGGKKDKEGNPYLYYTCNEVSKEGKAAACTLRSVPARAMDDLVMQIVGEIGRRPEVIKAAIAASNEEKQKSLRPLKSKLAEFQRRHKELNDELQRYLLLARQPGSEHFGHETLAAAEDLAKQKHEVEREIEKVKIDIDLRERVLADEKLIANSLLAFEEKVTVFPFEDQCEFLRLLLRQVRVNRLDPEKDPIPAGPPTWGAQIRTQWYSVNLDFYATDLITKAYKNGDLSSHLRDVGGGRGIRTLGGFDPTTVFKTVALNRSAIPPEKKIADCGSGNVAGYGRSATGKIGRRWSDGSCYRRLDLAKRGGSGRSGLGMAAGGWMRRRTEGSWKAT